MNLIDRRRRSARLLYRLFHMTDNEFAYTWIGAGVVVIVIAGVML